MSRVLHRIWSRIVLFRDEIGLALFARTIDRRRREIERWWREDAVKGTRLDDVMLPVFDQIWDKLEKRGSCDSRGGAEYQRVRAEWESAGKPVNIGEFIKWRANAIPGREN